MIRRHLWTVCAYTAPWLLIGGLIALMFGTAVMEVLAVEIAAVGLVLLGALLLLDELAGPRR